MEISKNIPARLKALRAARGYTQRDVYEAVGIVESAYQFYEYGKRIPRVTHLAALADYFGVSIDYLVGRTDNPRINL